MFFQKKFNRYERSLRMNNILLVLTAFALISKQARFINTEVLIAPVLNPNLHLTNDAGAISLERQQSTYNDKFVIKQKHDDKLHIYSGTQKLCHLTNDKLDICTEDNKSKSFYFRERKVEGKIVYAIKSSYKALFIASKLCLTYDIATGSLNFETCYNNNNNVNQMFIIEPYSNRILDNYENDDGISDDLRSQIITDTIDDSKKSKKDKISTDSSVVENTTNEKEPESKKTDDNKDLSEKENKALKHIAHLVKRKLIGEDNEIDPEPKLKDFFSVAKNTLPKRLLQRFYDNPTLENLKTLDDVVTNPKKMKFLFDDTDVDSKPKEKSKSELAESSDTEKYTVSIKNKKKDKPDYSNSEAADMEPDAFKSSSEEFSSDAVIKSDTKSSSTSNSKSSKTENETRVSVKPKFVISPNGTEVLDAIDLIVKNPDSSKKESKNNCDKVLDVSKKACDVFLRKTSDKKSLKSKTFTGLDSSNLTCDPVKNSTAQKYVGIKPVKGLDCQFFDSLKSIQICDKVKDVAKENQVSSNPVITQVVTNPVIMGSTTSASCANTCDKVNDISVVNKNPQYVIGKTTNNNVNTQKALIIDTIQTQKTSLKPVTFIQNGETVVAQNENNLNVVKLFPNANSPVSTQNFMTVEKPITIPTSNINSEITSDQNTRINKWPESNKIRSKCWYNN
ncbi:hypothetical protein EDEG_01852 [Edhazardia aedis USNM 41457]|uniref:Uncharacterized protein n=1 Tax=Edhazardia aedis (strain USNM 41457) TaxID=1003232 RepID=J8ZW00_EDHAE|nr:hypothetical protein EDEG_01852 [Edhazardia aedis USNM 41457]|eukprot:EJW03853.1 hypothetical protein EDEG_01852 [Edhazardia aedis USNM 41457]